MKLVRGPRSSKRSWKAATKHNDTGQDLESNVQSRSALDTLDTISD